MRVLHTSPCGQDHLPLKPTTLAQLASLPTETRGVPVFAGRSTVRGKVRWASRRARDGYVGAEAWVASHESTRDRSFVDRASACRDRDQHLSDRPALDGSVRGRRVLEAIAVQREAGLLADTEGAVIAADETESALARIAALLKERSMHGYELRKQLGAMTSSVESPSSRARLMPRSRRWPSTAAFSQA